MEHEITIEEKPCGEITVYQGVCSCQTYRTPWRQRRESPSYDAISHLNDVEQANAHDIAP